MPTEVTSGVISGAVVAAVVTLIGTLFNVLVNRKTRLDVQKLQSDLQRELQGRQIDLQERLSQQQQDFEREIKTSESETQARLAQQAEVLKPQLEAYRKLWALTEVSSPALGLLEPQGARILTQERRNDLESALRSWYYENGNGIFFSNEARDLFVYAKEELIDDRVEPEEVRYTLSRLRTQTKNDVGVYGEDPLKIIKLTPTYPAGRIEDEGTKTEGLAFLEFTPNTPNNLMLKVKMQVPVAADRSKPTKFRVALNDEDALDIEIPDEKSRHLSSPLWSLKTNLKAIKIKPVYENDVVGSTVLEYKSKQKDG